MNGLFWDILTQRREVFVFIGADAIIFFLRDFISQKSTKPLKNIIKQDE